MYCYCAFTVFNTSKSRSLGSSQILFHTYNTTWWLLSTTRLGECLDDFYTFFFTETAGSADRIFKMQQFSLQNALNLLIHTILAHMHVLSLPLTCLLVPHKLSHTHTFSHQSRLLICLPSSLVTHSSFRIHPQSRRDDQSIGSDDGDGGSSSCLFVGWSVERMHEIEESLL